MLDNIVWLGHSSIKIKYQGKNIYIDPYNLENESKDANIIFITHSHYDHYSKEDILKIKKETTKIIIPNDLYNDVKELGFSNDKIINIKPNNNYQVEDICFQTVNSYNINKNFHPKENNWVGYIIKLDKIIYIAGDTDITEENKQVKCDIAFLPIGGIYTMNAIEAATLANIIKPKVVIPIHYGSIVGTKEDTITFKNNLDNIIECYIPPKL